MKITLALVMITICLADQDTKKTTQSTPEEHTTESTENNEGTIDVTSDELISMTNNTDDSDVETEEEIDLTNTVDSNKKDEDTIKNATTVDDTIKNSTTVDDTIKNTTTIEDKILIFTEFPIQIGTEVHNFDVYRAGYLDKSYNKSVSNASRVIPQNEDAEVFYVSLVKDQHGDEISQTLRLSPPHLNFDTDVLSIGVQLPIMTNYNFKKPLEIVLVFKCTSEGNSTVEMQLDFQYRTNQSKTITLSFVKVCGEPTALGNKSQFLGDLLYYSLCCLGIIFGIYLTRQFKNALSKEPNAECLDTSYKRKYDKMSELPDTISVLQN